MNKEDLIKKYINYISDSDHNIKLSEVTLDQNLHEIIIDGKFCIVRELSWKEGLMIDMQSYKMRGKDLFFNDSYEKITILQKAFITLNNEKVNFENLSDEFIEKLWNEYKKYLHLSIQEINFLYESSKKYFSSNENEIFPLHPLIIEIDYMTKGMVHYSKNEFENLSMRQFEAIQLILATKNEI